MNKIMLKHSILFLAFLLMSATLFTSCDDDDDDYLGNWVAINAFNGIPRGFPVTFTANDTVYVGTGYDEENKDYLKDFWKYDPSQDTWTQVSDFPGTARSRGVAFGIDTYGYVGLGYDGDNALPDFYKYDAVNDEWTAIADFGGGKRYEAVAFSIDSKGYVGTGYDTERNYNDFYIYNPEKDTWTSGPAVPGTDRRRGAMSFVYEGKGYVVGGYGNSYLTNFCVYTPGETGTGSWDELRKITNNTDYSFDDDYEYIIRQNGVAFVYNDYAYITTGTYKNTWRYDFRYDKWKQKNAFEGTARTGAVAFVIEDMAYVGFGDLGSEGAYDLWTWYPDDEKEAND